MGTSDGHISYVTAAFQADLYLAKVMVDGVCDLILSADTDYAIVVEDPVVINGFTKALTTDPSAKERKKKMKNKIRFINLLPHCQRLG